MNQKLSVKIIGLVLIVSSWMGVSDAKAYEGAIVLSNMSFGCVTDVSTQSLSPADLSMNGSELLNPESVLRYNAYMLANGNNMPSCKSVKELKYVLGGTALALQAGTIVLACTGVGTPVSVMVQVTSLAFKFVELQVGNIECRDYKKEEEVRKATVETTCKVMNQLGVACDPATISDRPYTPINRDNRT